MAKKRFTDIEIWDKAWYMELSPRLKCLMKYMFDKCDPCGCWKPNWKLASLHIAEDVEFSDLNNLPNDQYEVLESGKIFIPDFINFQYGQLSKNSPAHKPVFLALEKNNLLDRVFNRVSHTLQEKEKDKEKEMDKDKEEETQKKTEKFLIPTMQNIWKKHKPEYPLDTFKDSTALQAIAVFICKQAGMNYYARDEGIDKNLNRLWDAIAKFVASHKFFKNYSLHQVEKHIQSITQEIQNGQSVNQNGHKTTGKVNGEQLNEAYAAFYSQSKQAGNK